MTAPHSEPDIVVCEDREALNLEAASRFVDLAAEAIANRDRFMVALSGGSTPKALFELLATDEWRARVDWSRTHLFWGDERFVPKDHADSKVQIRRASAIDPSWLLDLYLDRIEERDELVWDPRRERVERVARMTYDGLAIDEQRDVDGARRAGPAAAELLAKQAIAAGIEKFVDPEKLVQWRA